LNAVARSLSFDLKREEVKVLTVHPGWVKTRLGGQEAPLTTTESVRGVRALVDNSTAQSSGTFFNYDGEIIDW
jgi:NAD(P)-dependent dehydrogenase (short-subunit alcohol dehydrogenase family)